jgi:hypothetical protein
MHLHAIHGVHVDRRIHERHRLVRDRGRIRADMRCETHGARQPVSGRRHVRQFESRRQRNDGAIGIGHQANSLGTRADAAEPADDAQHLAAGRTGNRARHKVGSAFHALYAFDLQVFHAPRAQ